MSERDHTLRIRIGDVEFEATGPQIWVEYIIHDWMPKFKRIASEYLKEK